MMRVSDHGSLLRARDGGEQQVTPLELFFDLVFVFAVTQLSHRLLVAGVDPEDVKLLNCVNSKAVVGTWLNLSLGS